MDELVISNAQLGLTFHRIEWNGEETVWGDDIRKALKWGRVIDMVDGLKQGVEYYKVKISDLESEGYQFCGNFHKTSEKGGRPATYAYLVTRQGVTRLIATRRPHDIKDDPELAAYLDSLQDFIFGEVLPEVLATGSYVGKPLVAGQHAIASIPKTMSEALRFMADEYDAHELTIGAFNNVKSQLGEVLKELDEAKKTKAQISNTREATALAKVSVLTRKIEELEARVNYIMSIAQKYIDWVEHMREARWGKSDSGEQLKLF